MNKYIGIIVLLSLTLFSCNTKENSKLKEKYNLNGSPKLIEETSYKALTDFEELEKGRVISSVKMEFSKNGERLNKFIIVDTSTTYKYNDQDIVIQKTEYFEDGKISSITNYNEDGNILKVKYFGKGRVTDKDIYVYDDIGNLIEKSTYDIRGILAYGNKYEYDVKGNKIKELLLSEDEIVSKTEMIYDKNNNLIESNEYYKGGHNKFRFEYSMDTRENWIKKVTYNNDIATYITIRKIKYY